MVSSLIFASTLPLCLTPQFEGSSLHVRTFPVSLNVLSLAYESDGDGLIAAPDTVFPYYGPNGMGCLNYGAAVDGTPFDRKFTCDCSKVAVSLTHASKNIILLVVETNLFSWFECACRQLAPTVRLLCLRCICHLIIRHSPVTVAPSPGCDAHILTST